MNRCGRVYHAVTRTAGSFDSVAVMPTRCKNWNCDFCRRRKSATVINAIGQHFRADSLWFLTITTNHQSSIEETWRELGRKWNLLVTYARKHNPHFDYIKIVEPHKNRPYPHLHILTSLPIFTTDFFLYSKTLGFGQQQQQQRITSDAAAGYVSKYLSKPWPDNGADKLRHLAKARVLSTSRSIGALFFSKPIGKTAGKFLDPAESVATFERLSMEHAFAGQLINSYEITEKYIYADYGSTQNKTAIDHIVRHKTQYIQPFGRVTIYSAVIVTQCCATIMEVGANANCEAN